ncbi:type VII secretion integral membrane protein EccD [Streptosporangium sp. NPDC023615]|uniref:type VII secretion integral membrane protein EccD n=1 Tax=Streptosporangium sp. NPDC023615 TaxID=3154794 RepID=UPI0034282B9F
MNQVTAIPLCRITVVTPRRRVDLAVPSDLPLSHLLPDLLTATGEADAIPPAGGWGLQRIGAAPMPPAAGLNELGIRDGEVLYLLPRSSQLPEAVFDDVADTVATGVKERTGRWRPAHTRGTGLTVAAVAIVAAVLVLAASGPGWGVVVAFAGVCAVLAMVAGAALSRAAGDGRAGAVIGYTALPHAFLAGAYVPASPAGPGAFGAPNLLAAFAVTALIATVTGWVVAEGLPNFFGVGLAAVVGAICSAVVMLTGAPAAGVAAVAAAVILACAPLIPTTSFRLARLPLPALPANAEELRADTEDIDGADVRRRAAEAERFATGLTAGVALVALGALPAVLSASGWTVPATVVTLSLALLMRARVFQGTGQRLWLLGSGLTGLLTLTLGVAFTVPGSAPAVTIGLVCAAALACGMALFLPVRRPSPFWGRAGDIVEFCLILGLLPLALGVLDVYATIRGLSG